MSNTNQLLRINEVSAITSIAKSTIYLWIAQGRFPKPISLSTTIKVWKLASVLEWIDSHSEEEKLVLES
jgi:prophage regulatory protein